MKTVGVLLGGTSSEREISITSGRAIAQALRRFDLEVIEIDLRRSAREHLAKCNIDIAFIAMHGKGGEDGRVQKILEDLSIPYTGSDPKASALAFDKGEMKKVFSQEGIPTPHYSVVSEPTWKKRFHELKFPVFIKPLREGSSIGIRYASDEASLEAALKQSFTQYPRLILEERIFGREITVGILGERALPVIELLPKSDFFNFEAKYTKGMTDYIVPAQLGRYYGKLVQGAALRAHTVLGLRDFSRVDMFLNRDGQPYVLEVNSIPGFTETSLLPKAARQAGIDFPALCLQLLDFAWKREKGESFRTLDKIASSVS